MPRSKEHFLIARRLNELSYLKLKNSGLSVSEQIENDQLVGRIAYKSESSCKKIAKIIRKIGHGDIII